MNSTGCAFIGWKSRPEREALVRRSPKEELNFQGSYTEPHALLIFKTMTKFITLISSVSNFAIETLYLMRHCLTATHRSIMAKTRSLERGTTWIRIREFKRFASLVAWITRTQHLRVLYILLLSRIERLIVSCSFTWAFAYMKETLRLTTRALAGTPEKVSDSPIRVKRDFYGLPTIIPIGLRNILRYFIDENLSSQVMRRSIIAILTILSVFRSFETKVTPKLDSIVNPFNGVTKVLPQQEVKEAVKSFGRKLFIGNFIPVISQKAGPNAPFSTWAAGIDALAFIHYPNQLYTLIRWMYIQRAYRYLVWLLALIILFGPLYLIIYWLGGCKKLVLGKLSVVYNQAGKARVVASTNWWIQSALKPLHESIFALLGKLPTDGTLDQEGCFNKFLTRADSFAGPVFGNKLSGFDLSAATDRLPIDLQVQILNEFGLMGDLWKDMLDIEWLYHPDRFTDEYIRYAVGQPMGAYSSWAMLALSHHVVVRVAALRAKAKLHAVNYAVLGDDIVINNDKVAEQYLLIMRDLGLEISTGKSIISYKFTEFAKTLKGPGLDITPLGSGLVLSSLRSHYMVPALMAVAVSKFTYSPQEVLDLLRNIPGGLFNRALIKEICLNSVWQSFLNNTWLKELSLLNVKTLNRYSSFFAADALQFPYKLADALLSKMYRELEVQKENAHEAMTNFLMEGLSLLAARSVPLRVLEILMKPFNPGFWMYFLDSLDLPIRIEERYEEIRSGFYTIGTERVVDQILFLQKEDPRLSVMDIAKMTPARAKLSMRYFKELQYSMEWR